MKTLDKYNDAVLSGSRRTGKTTRVADFLIQELFKNPDKWIPITDPDSWSKNDYIPDRYLKDIIVKRLLSEHPVFLENKIGSTSIRTGYLLAENSTREESIQAYMIPPLWEQFKEIVSIHGNSSRRIYLLKLKPV